jgi:purine-cytosine permease-like protein
MSFAGWLNLVLTRIVAADEDKNCWTFMNDPDKPEREGCKEEEMRKRIIISLIIGIIIGIAAAKFYMAALRAGHAAYLFPDYGVGIIIGGLSALIAFKYLKK